MPDYKKMYFHLAGQVATAIDLLVAAQQQGEDGYVNALPQPPIVLPPLSKNEEPDGEV